MCAAHSIASCSNGSMRKFVKPEKGGDLMAVFEHEARFSDQAYVMVK